jgi:hypothetical protein
MPYSFELRLGRTGQVRQASAGDSTGAVILAALPLSALAAAFAAALAALPLSALAAAFAAALALAATLATLVLVLIWHLILLSQC